MNSPRTSSPESDTGAPPPLFVDEFSQASVVIGEDSTTTEVDSGVDSNILGSSGAADSTSCSTEWSYFQDDLLKNVLWEVPSGDSLKENLGTPKSTLSKIVVVWAESFDDTRRFPINKLHTGLHCDIQSRFVVIFVHPLHSGLYKTTVRSLNKTDKFNTVGIIDEKEKVVSKEILGTVVRETCLAIRTASLLEQPPKLRPKSRRLNKIDTIVHNHGCNSVRDKENGYYNAFCKLTS